MKKLFILIQFFLFLGLGFTSTIYGQGESQTEMVSSSYQSEQGNYMIGRYVIGSGGVTGAVGTNHIHWATAGETCVGGMQGANNFLFSGFWLTAGYGTGVEEQEAVDIPATFELHQNYPNPFNPETTIQYDLPKTCKATVEILNVVGQAIRLLSSLVQGPGSMHVVWDGKNEYGEPVGSGIYLCRLTTHSTDTGENHPSVLFQQIKKMVLVK